MNRRQFLRSVVSLAVASVFPLPTAKETNPASYVEAVAELLPISFVHVGTVTGRLTSSIPDIQNLCDVPKPVRTYDPLFKTDYAELELRIFCTELRPF